MVAMDINRLLDGRLKVRHLLLVVTVAEQGSVVGAAERLRVTQPVVTRACGSWSRSSAWSCSIGGRAA
jgi:hypothetical protein